ncbi:hypothetical protein HGR_01689 [Hylemonella gracilis ATCC 19624]|uniref:Uncharacterized protein n=1 Tax=Hylemonella gracilis ATCC 19624 TaxID=887062 RepID=F3KPH8_9BURK|nr:hypothetical protein HGR_01689 [Hylemonella gracilis ATCC 19624]
MRSQSQELVQTVAVFKLSSGGNAAGGFSGGSQPSLLALR